MGADGSDLLRLSHTYQARLTPIPNPLRLRAFGRVDSLEAMAAEILDRTSRMRSHTVKLQCAAGVRPDLIQTISRISGAFIENSRESQVQITELDEESGEIARRLAERAGIEARDAERRPISAHISEEGETSDEAHSPFFTGHNYALYPFLVPGVLPWNMGYSNPFRVRRVGDWLPEDQRPKSSPLISARLASRNGVSKTLRETLFGGLPPLPLGFSRTVSATAGYHLISAPESRSLARVSLMPPIRDSFDLDTFFEWLKAGKGSTTFLPGVPPDIRAETLKPRRLIAMEDILIYRLRYQAREGSKEASRSPSRATPSDITDILDVQINFTLWHSHTSTNQLSETSGLEKAPLDRFTSECSTIPPRVMVARRGTTSSLDVLLPDRQFDIRLSVLDLIRITSRDLPQDLIEHLIDCRQAFSANGKLPESPFSVVVDGVTYFLMANEVVRTSQREESNVSRVFDGAAPHGETAVTIVEKVADRDVLDQQILQCCVHSSEPRLDIAWDKFLSQCDRITGYDQEEVLSFQHFTLPRHEETKQRMYA
ncbi:hypothetical protein DACRYDRAFT_23440 [Dacryopinax primogenitus]|uniref:Uncharacterized protein n=1 Tax=Dacryopinax primogenitus (strain DJM 731) TaxID=1858805 RepID=M5FUH4_DACPD|nr:uncharacterized protein DACRYDRAFT_23440 [Dacryopinax primogenitus]EJT99883.1 hypothetical protein DACRYDRAFT_23440 [Dacryopinax primogenitus]